MNAAHRQLDHRVRFDWGPTGAAAIAAGADIAVVVDVLSFTTTLCVAVERGMTVLPYRWKDERAAAHAEQHAATLAVGRLEARALPPVLGGQPVAGRDVAGVRRRRGSSCPRRTAPRSPSALPRPAAPWSAPACATGPPLPTGSLARGGTVAVVAAGERWPDDSLRPAAEDLWGAGAVLALLPRDDLLP